MPRVNTVDSQPGPLPDIRTAAEGVTFTMTPCGLKPPAVLVIRCDANGGVWISIQKA